MNCGYNCAHQQIKHWRKIAKHHRTLSKVDDAMGMITLTCLFVIVCHLIDSVMIQLRFLYSLRTTLTCLSTISFVCNQQMVQQPDMVSSRVQQSWEPPKKPWMQRKHHFGKGAVIGVADTKLFSASVECTVKNGFVRKEIERLKRKNLLEANHKQIPPRCRCWVLSSSSNCRVLKSRLGRSRSEADTNIVAYTTAVDVLNTRKALFVVLIFLPSFTLASLVNLNTLRHRKKVPTTTVMWRIRIRGLLDGSNNHSPCIAGQLVLSFLSRFFHKQTFSRGCGKQRFGCPYRLIAEDSLPCILRSCQNTWLLCFLSDMIGVLFLPSEKCRDRFDGSNNWNWGNNGT